jgi:hypothetical protein
MADVRRKTTTRRDVRRDSIMLGEVTRRESASDTTASRSRIVEMRRWNQGEVTETRPKFPHSQAEGTRLTVLILVYNATQAIVTSTTQIVVLWYKRIGRGLRPAYPSSHSTAFRDTYTTTMQPR